VAGALVALAANAVHAASPSERCVKGKLKAAGRHARDLGRCYEAVAASGDYSAVTACTAGASARALARINKTTQKVEIGGGVCPANGNDLLLTGPDAWLPIYVLTDLFPPANNLPNQCVRRKINGIGRYADALAKCLSKNYVRPDQGRLGDCQDKARDKLLKSYTQASKVGPCAGTTTSVFSLVSARVRDQLENLRFGAGILESPDNGTFTIDPTAAVAGGLRGTEPLSDLTVNGVSVLPLDSTNGFTTNVPLDPGAIFNAIVAEGITPGGELRRDRVTVVAGDGVNTGFVLDGDLSPESIALRFTDTGLAQVKPIIKDLAAGAFDIGPLILEQNPILDDECVAEIFGLCAYWATVNVTDVGFSDLLLDIDPLGSGQTEVAVSIQDFFVKMNLHVRDAVAVSFDCGLDISADSATITGDYDMSPAATAPSKVDVNQIGGVSIDLGGFGHDFTSGICDAPIIGDIIDLIIGGSLEGLVSDGFSDNLADPDGTGPLDSPIADGIEGALDGIDIAGPVGQAIGVNLLAEFATIEEDANGITFSVNAGVTASLPAPGAPDLPASYTVAEPFPAFGTTTPVGGSPYGIALGLSTSAFNQLLKAEVESGLLRATISEFDLGLGGGPIPLTIGLLSTFVPELTTLYAGFEPVVIEATPTLAPVFTGAEGPGGELAELLMSHLLVDIRLASTGILALRLALDATVGIELEIAPDGIGFGFGTPDPNDVTIDILINPTQADEQGLKNFMSSVLPFAFPELAGALGGLPLPTFLGLELQPIEVSRQGDFMTIFANLGSAP
jgi:hypothetical protein